MNDSYEIVVPLARRNVDFFTAYVVPMMRKNLSPKKIVVIGAAALETKIVSAGCDFIDEDKLNGHMTLASLQKKLSAKGAKPERAGWYFQQFLKLEYARHTDSKYYLVWDSDTIPLRNISFFDGNGGIFYYAKDEFHRPYFDTIRTLFGGRVGKMIPDSFIAEHMMIDSALMMEMLDDIERNSPVDGKYFFDRILNAVAPRSLSGSGFSEFETFGNWVLCRGGEYRNRKLASLREGALFLGTHPTEKVMARCALSYDIVSVENAAGFKKILCHAVSRCTNLLMLIGVPLPKIVAPYHRLKRIYYRRVKKKDRFFTAPQKD